MTEQGHLGSCYTMSVDWAATGQKIREARLALGLNVDDVGSYIKGQTGVVISGKTINRIENGHSTKLSTLENVCAGLGLTLELQVLPLSTREVISEDDLPSTLQRVGMIRRLIKVIDHLPKDHADILLSQVGIWERKFLKPKVEDPGRS